MVTDNQYRTSDTTLATCLIIEGFRLQKIDYSNPRFEFIFPISLEIHEYAAKYISGNTQIEPTSFSRVNKKLLRILRSQIQWEDD